MGAAPDKIGICLRQREPTYSLNLVTKIINIVNDKANFDIKKLI